MVSGSGALIFESFKAVAFKRPENSADMGAAQLETPGDALFVPAFVGHAHHCPAGFVGVGKVGKERQVEFELHRDGMALEKVFDGMVIGLVAEFALHNALDFAPMDGRIELFQVQHVGGYGVGIHVSLAPGLLGSLIAQSQHAVDDKVAGFVADGGAVDAGLTTAFGGCFGKQHNGPDGFVIVLDGIDELALELMKIFLSRHKPPPFGPLHRLN